jgi:hypothetical protein
MFERQGGIAFGLSARKTEFATNAGASVNIWLSNESDAPQHYGVCCELTFLQKIQVFNSYGLPLENLRVRLTRDFEMRERVTTTS